MPVPLDADGFLRRACPACNREFKWLPSDQSEPPSDGRYGCPYCLARSDSDEFWTEDQIEAARTMAGDWLVGELKHRGWQVRRSTSLAPPLYETDDMTRVDPSCHKSEPVKVYSTWVEAGQPVHCIVCGSEA